MNIKIRNVENTKEIYEYMTNLAFPYNYKPDYRTWEKSYLYDVDGNGKTLFSELKTKGAYCDNELIGFIQYGKSAFGFDDSGEISDSVSCHVIRNFFFPEDNAEVGDILIKEALNELSAQTPGRIYAFFHYFGMSCYARHGKLYEKFNHIHELLIKNGFQTEHENVFYSSTLSSESKTMVKLEWHNETAGGQRYCDFILDNATVGGCEVHFLEMSDTAYLRWIFTNEELRGNGVGTMCMEALKTDLFKKRITRFDTDTALTNTIAQHYYDKNGFINEGLTRSYFKD